MRNLKTLKINEKLDSILRDSIAIYEGSCDGKKAVTLKDIYGLPFWLMISKEDARKLGYRFRCICEGLGFKYTGDTRNKANLYIRLK